MSTGSNKLITIGFNVFDDNQVAIWNDSMDLPDDKYDIVYPYDGKFYDVPKEYHPKISETKKVHLIKCYGGLAK